MEHKDAAPKGISRATTVYFLYHEILQEPSKYSYSLSRDAFRQHLETLQTTNLQTDGFFRAGITFDDGHFSDFAVALPLLVGARMTARFFITAGWTGTKPGYMDWEAVEELHEAGQIVGAHGWSHKMLSRCSPDELREQLRRPKETLEQHLGAAVTEMSLPGGRLTADVLEAAKQAGYERIFTSVPQAHDGLSEIIGRINVTSATLPSDLESLLRLEGSALKKMARKHSMKLALRRLMGDTLYFKLWALRTGYVQNEEVEI